MGPTSFRISMSSTFIVLGAVAIGTVTGCGGSRQLPSTSLTTNAEDHSTANPILPTSANRGIVSKKGITPKDTYQPSYPPVGTCASGDTRYGHAYSCHIVAGKTASMTYSASVPAVQSGGGGAGDTCSPGSWATNQESSSGSAILTISPTVTGPASDCGKVRNDTVTFLASSTGTQAAGAEYLVGETYTVCHKDLSCDPP